MRHNKTINHLGRTSEQRHLLLANLSKSLFLHKRIKTTVAKAKALRKYVEPLITKSKDASTHSRRTVFSYLQDKVAVKELFDEISQNVKERNGGYTRIIRIGNRFGDNAEMCMMELVDYNKDYVKTKGSSSKSASKTKTTRRRTSKSAASSASIEASAE